MAHNGIPFFSCEELATQLRLCVPHLEIAVAIVETSEVVLVAMKLVVAPSRTASANVNATFLLTNTGAGC